MENKGQEIQQLAAFSNPAHLRGLWQGQEHLDGDQDLHKMRGEDTPGPDTMAAANTRWSKENNNGYLPQSHPGN